MTGEKRVLVVDDDESTRELIGVALSEEGYVIVSAANGREALDIVHQQPISLILLDLWMPLMDGTAFLHAYQQLPPPRAPVVVLAASLISTERAPGVEANGFLAKPFDLVDLLATVARFTGGA